MKHFLKNYWKTLLFFASMGLLGGFCVGLFTLDSYPPAFREEILAQGLTPMTLAAVSALQAAGYGLVLGAAGIAMAKKTGLWKDETTFQRKPLTAALTVSVIGGLAMILLDILFFGRFSQAIRDSYLTKPSWAFIVGAVTYGAVIEEVMLRLFMMTLIALLLHLIFERRKKISSWVLAAANIISALLFAAGHLPATAVMLGLTPMILVRCFLLNGGIGLMFGWLYRKFGLRYAMLAHGGCHVVSKAVWILFL